MRSALIPTNVWRQGYNTDQLFENKCNEVSLMTSYQALQRPHLILTIKLSWSMLRKLRPRKGSGYDKVTYRKYLSWSEKKALSPRDPI